MFNGSCVIQQEVLLTNNGTLVRFIPKDVYNFTPYDVDSGLPIPQSLDPAISAHLGRSVSIAHFKGPRKHLMLSYAASLPASGNW